MSSDLDLLSTQKKHVACVLEQLLNDYRQTRVERRAIADALPTTDTEFSLLEELEVLTIGIRGISNQFISTNIENRGDVITQLMRMDVFSVPAVAEFYLDSNAKFEGTKLYISLLDYLRLRLLTYLQVERPVSSVAV